MRWVLVTVLVGGCRAVFGIGNPDLGTGDGALPGTDSDGHQFQDAPHQQPQDGTAPGCYGVPIEICLPTTPNQTLTISISATIDTDTSTLCTAFTSPQITDACVIAGTEFALTGGTIRVTGARPMIILATGQLTLGANGIIDAASHSGSNGSAANPAVCTTGTEPGISNGTSGGGAGGTFSGLGGAGGKGASSAGGTGGTAPAVGTMPIDLRGGCAGQTGAGMGAQPGTRGNGGGAVLAIANTIEIDGTLNASGGSGGGGMFSTGGGGGGGSGGMIIFEATTLTIASSAKVFANGGGGGEGSGPTMNGVAGTDSTGPMTAAVGGTGGTNNAGDGGRGSVGSTLAGTFAGGGTQQANGGGGGGGAGYIIAHVVTANLSAATSPPLLRP